MKEFNYFKELHKDHTYPDGRPYWPHLLRVGLILKHITNNNPDIDTESLTIAGFGHDCLEDTNVTLETLKQKFNPQITNLIFGMTNEQDDNHIDAYVKKIISSSENIRLMKLADLFDNYTQIANCRSLDEARFLKSKIFPIMGPVFNKITETQFNTSSGKKLLKLTIHSKELAHQTISEWLDES